MNGWQRYQELGLSKADRQKLRRRSGGGQEATARVWRRMQTLQVDDDDKGPGSSKHCAASGPIGGDPASWLLLCATVLVLRRRARR